MDRVQRDRLGGSSGLDGSDAELSLARLLVKSPSGRSSARCRRHSHFTVFVP